MRLGIISDTHGTITSRALQALQNADHILHAGDITTPEVIRALETIAPVTAIRGNMDHSQWGRNLPVTDMLEFNGVYFYMLHNLHALDIDPKAAGVQVVISGHTHQSDIRTIDGVLYFNPGSASHGRHGNSESVGQIELNNGRIVPGIITLG